MFVYSGTKIHNYDESKSKRLRKNVQDIKNQRFYLVVSSNKWVREPSPDPEQTKEELAQSHTMYKVILCCGCSDFPYVNVTSDKEKIENNLSSFYDIAEKRDKAIKHLKALCSGAKTPII